jgi:hypothetical protein
MRAKWSLESQQSAEGHRVPGASVSGSSWILASCKLTLLTLLSGIVSHVRCSSIVFHVMCLLLSLFKPTVPGRWRCTWAFNACKGSARRQVGVRADSESNGATPGAEEKTAHTRPISDDDAAFGPRVSTQHHFLHGVPTLAVLAIAHCMGWGTALQGCVCCRFL